MRQWSWWPWTQQPFSDSQSEFAERLFHGSLEDLGWIYQFGMTLALSSFSVRWKVAWALSKSSITASSRAAVLGPGLIRWTLLFAPSMGQTNTLFFLSHSVTCTSKHKTATISHTWMSGCTVLLLGVGCLIPLWHSQIFFPARSGTFWGHVSTSGPVLVAVYSRSHFMKSCLFSLVKCWSCADSVKTSPFWLEMVILASQRLLRALTLL